MLSRPRLMKVVDEQRQRRLVVICAGAGYGKSTLLARLYKGYPGTAVWYQFDQRDQSPDFLISNLARGIGRHSPAFVRQTMNRAGLALKDGPERDRVFAVFVNGIVESGAVPAAIFFDNFEVVNDNEAVTAFMRFLLNHLPSGCRLFVASRERPGLSLGRLRAHRSVLDLEAESLKFSLGETAQLFEKIDKTRSKAWDEREFALLYAKTDGWPFALGLVRDEIRDGNREADAILSSAEFTGAVNTYLDREVFSRLDDGMKSFLMRNSLTDCIEPEVCDRILACDSGPSAAGLLRLAEEKNLMTYSANSGRVYRYHPLFRQFLQRQFQKNAKRSEIAAMHRRYAKVYEQQNNLSNAVDHYFKAGALEEAVELTGAHGEKMLQEGKLETVWRWLGQIPPEKKKGRPGLDFLAACILWRKGRISEARRKLSSANAGFKQSGDQKGLFKCAITESRLGKVDGNQEGRKAAEKAVNYAKSAAEVVEAKSSLATLHLLSGDKEKAKKLVDEASAVCREPTAGTRLVLSSVFLTEKYLSGEFKAFLPDVERGVAEANVLHDIEKNCRYLNDQARVLYLTANYETALGSASESLACARRLGDRLKEWAVYDTLGQVHLGLGGPGTGRAHIERAIDWFKTAGIPAPHVYNHLGSYQRRRGKLEEALKAHSEALAQSQKVQNVYMTAMSLVNIAADKMRLSNGKRLEGESELKAACGLARKHDYKYIQSQSGFHRAGKALAGGDTEKALAEIGKSLDISAKHWHSHFLVQEGRNNPDLLSFAFENGVQQDYLVDIFGKIGPEAMPALAPLLKSKSSEVRRAAVGAVGAAGGISAARFIRSCLKDKDSRVSFAADDELARLRSCIEAPEEILTRRELQVLRLMAEGLGNVAIGERLFIDERTVKTHVGKIFNKLGLTKRLQAAMYFKNTGTKPASE